MYDTRQAEAFFREVIVPLQSMGVTVRDFDHDEPSETISAVVVLPTRDRELRTQVLGKIHEFVVDQKFSVSVAASLVHA